MADVAATPPSTSHSPSLPLPFSSSPATAFELIAQGAEAQLYRTTFLTATTPAALKVRPTKAWRHPHLDRRLTRQRILAEARVLAKCRREGVRVPAVLALDADAGWSVYEWVPGCTVKHALRQRKGAGAGSNGIDGDDDHRAVRDLLARVGTAVAKLHAVGIIHGDLTTSNMMLSPARPLPQDQAPLPATLDGDIVLIDFGLASQAVQEEDRAVDLYVLERAFGSTHPREEELFDEVLQAYGQGYKGAKTTLKRLEDVRMRGRKKSMLG